MNMRSEILIMFLLASCQTYKVEIAHTKLEIPYEKAELPTCNIQQTNEYELNNGMFFEKEEYIKLIKNINAMRSCFNDVREKYKLSVENYNNLIDIINDKKND